MLEGARRWFNKEGNKLSPAKTIAANTLLMPPITAVALLGKTVVKQATILIPTSTPMNAKIRRSWNRAGETSWSGAAISVARFNLLDPSGPCGFRSCLLPYKAWVVHWVVWDGAKWWQGQGKHDALGPCLGKSGVKLALLWTVADTT